MPNYCSYTARIVSKRKQSVERFLAILNYKDYGLKDSRGLYLARTFSAECEDGILKEDGLFYADVYGDVAWSIHTCWIGGTASYHNDATNKYPDGDPKFSVWNYRDGIHYSNLIITIPELCKLLKCAIEIWSDEGGIGFQEHYLIDSDGDPVIEGCVDWSPNKIDEETGEEILDTAEGGFDDYGDLRPPKSLYGRTYR